MDSFQGCYKDGTEPGTRDCRYFLAAFFALRILIFIVYGMTANVMTFAIVTLMFIIAMSTVVMAMKPFKTPPTHSNMMFVAYLQLFAFLYTTIVAVNLLAFLTASFFGTLTVIGFLAACVPLVDALFSFAMLAVRRRRGILWFVTSCCRRQNPSNGYEELPDGGSGEEEVLAYRIGNPEAYPKGNLSSFASFRKQGKK